MRPLEKGITLPTKQYGKKYPWADAQIGDSFLIDAATRNGAISMARKASISLGRTFVAKHTSAGFRVWRTA